MSKFKLLAILTVLLLSVASLAAQTPQVKGTVTDQSGKPMLGVAVTIQGTAIGATTNADGKFVLNARKGQTVIFTYIGYDMQSMILGDATELNIKLTETAVGMDEVVVVGYGTQSKRTVTAAISKVSGQTLANTPITSVGEGLKGKIAGVRVYSSDNAPGREATFLIRGGSSKDKSNDPLILVDGIERSMAGINPQDIESIEVLKDAASSAIYGSRASNGVVLITTKKGAANRAPEITFNASWAMQDAINMVEYCDSETAINLMRRRLAQGPHPEYLTANDKAYSSGNTAESQFSTRYLQSGESVPAGYLSMKDPLDETKTLIYQNNDWVAKCFSPALWQNYYAGVTGGTDRINYMGSIGYVDDGGVAKGSGYSRFSARSAADIKITDKLKFNASVDFSQTNSDEYDSSRGQYAVINRGLMTPTTQKFYYDAGEYEGTPTKSGNASSTTTLFYEFYNTNQHRYNRLGLNGGLTYNIVKGLEAAVNASYFSQAMIAESFRKANIYEGDRRATATIDDSERIKLDAHISYNRTFGNHSLSAMAGYEYQTYDYFYMFGQTNDASSDKIATLNAGPTKTNVTSSRVNEVWIGYFGRVNYDFKKKYMLTFTFREDGSSRFIKGNQWGFFPGISGGWIVSDEEWLRNNNTINNLKLRASYGQTGNNQVGYYDALGLYAVGTNYDGESSTATSSMPNQNLTWENTTQLDLGFDLGILNNRLQISADYFNKVTGNLITSKTLPNTSGYSSVTTNIGKVRFYGFDFELNSTNIDTRNFKWNTTFTWSFVKNKVVSLPDNGRDKNRIGGYSVKMADGSTYEFGGIAEGEPLGRMYGYQTDYIIATQEQADNACYDSQSRGWDWVSKKSKGTGKKAIGDYEWQDLNGDGVINGSDMYYQGTTLPHSTGGLNNEFTYRSLTLSVYFDWALGHSINNAFFQRMMCNFFGNNTSLPTEVLKCWDPENTGYGVADINEAKYARFGGNDSDDLNKNFRPGSNVFTQKADYLCLRDITLLWNVPCKSLAKYGIHGVAISVSGNNLHYFTNIIGISPELGSANTYSTAFNSYPPIRRFSCGVKLTF